MVNVRPAPFRSSTIPQVLCSLFLLLAGLIPAQAQVFLITEGSITTCGGALLDSGGEGASGYSNNENYTLTICPNDPDSAISLSFITFNLSVLGTDPVDNLTIYDGSSTSAPLLGIFTGDNIPGIVSASYDNPDGCLTLVFTSNDLGTGVFAASISCFEPCQPPVAVGAMSEAAPALVCQDEVVTFNASGSHAAPGYTVARYIWDFDDGSMDSTSGPYVYHAYPVAGEYVTSLVVEDDNGCRNTNTVDLQVLVSTTPDFHGFDDIQTCLGSTVNLNADVDPVTWSGFPDADFGEGIELPDELGTPFTSTLTFDGFAPGQTLNSISDLLSVCIEMEHSFMGDFVLSLTSPTGQTVIFHQQGGGGTYLGIPDDNDEGNPQPGTCWQYCFSPTATNGTWVDNAGGTLPAGTYESLNPMSAFVGSALNGTWTLTFVDLWGADNGFICSWGIDFNPAIMPDVTVYTPDLGTATADSAYWTGPYITYDPNNPLVATAQPTVLGDHVYTFTVWDDFGCSYDTSLTVTITPGAVFEATAAPPAVCGNPIQLGIHFTPPMPQGAITYNWSPAAGLSNPNSAFPIANPPVPTWYRLHAFPAGHPECGMVDSVQVNPLTTLADDSLIVHPLCHGIDGTVQVITTGTGGPWDYTWKDAYGNVVQTTLGALGDSFTGPAGLYKAIIKEGPNGNNCKDSLMAEIIQPELLQMVSLSNDTTICLTGLATLMASATGGTEPLQLNWNNALPPGGFQMVSPLDTTVYVVSVSDANDCPSDTLETTVNVRGPLSFTLPDTLVVCPEVDTQLFANLASGGDGAYAFDWGYGPSADTVRTVNLTASQNICVTLTDGCETPALPLCTYFDVLPIPVLELSADTALGCAPFHVTFTVKDTTGGATVDWNFGTDASVLAGPVRDFIYSLSGYYDVTAIVHWPNGCNDTTVADDMIRVVPIPKADFTWDPDPASILAPTLTFTEQAGPWAVDYRWQFAGVDTASGPTATYTFPEDVGGVYPVTLRVENYLGCADSVMRLVEIHDQFLVFTPNAFTPDGDGLNDFFFIQGNDIDMKAGFDLRIFDRWGREIFATNDPTKPWDGRLDGAVVKNGVYVWKLKARSAYTQNDHEMLGHVSVVR